MENYGFLRIAAGVPTVRVADVDYNVGEILKLAEKAENKQISLLAFPELSITGYTCADLFG